MQRAITLLAGLLVLCLAACRGIDVLHVERAADGMRPRNRTAGRSELDRRPAWGTPSPRWGFACSLPVPS